MDLILQWFQHNLDIVFFIYGLAFMVMGVSLWVQPKIESESKLAPIVWLIAAFGFTHGANEFLDMWSVIKGRMPFWDLVRSYVLIISFVFLFEFGRRLLRICGQKYLEKINKLCGFWLTIIIGLVVCILGFLSADFWKTATIFARYLLGFPGGLLVSLGLVCYYKFEEKELGPLKVKKYFSLASLFFLSYGILSGLVVPKADFLPARWVNTDSFLSTVHMPVQVFRAACAMIIGWSVLKIFNLETVVRLQRGVADRKRAEENLRVAFDGLEIRIQERTKELTEANALLKVEIAERQKAEAALKKSQDFLLLQNKILVDLTDPQALQMDDLKKLFSQLTEISAETLGVERVSIWLFDEGNTKFCCHDLFDSRKRSHSEGAELLVTNFPSYFRALREARVIDAGDAHADPRTKEFSESYLTPLGISSMLDVPLRRGEQLRGVVCHEHIGQKRLWSLEEKNFAMAIANLLSHSMESHERKYFEQKLRVINSELEARVEARTKDLERTNQTLQAMVAEQSHIEGALRDSNARYQRITSSITDYIYTVRLKDGQPVETVHGPGCVAITGYTDAEFHKQEYLWISIIYEEDRPRVKGQIEDIYSKRIGQPIEHRIIHKDGNVRWIRNTPVLYFDRQGHLTAYDGVVKDITAIKEYEQKLLTETEKANQNRQEAVDALNELKRAQAANISILANLTRAKQHLEEQSKELKRALAVKDEFTSTVSHELRTPLAISKEALSLVLRGKVGQISEKQNEIITMASSNIDRLALLINDVLDTAKMEAGKIELQKESVDIRQLVRDSCLEWQLRAQAKKIALHLKPEDGSLMLSVDKMRFLQVLSNLIDNAIKFTPENGKIDVAINETEQMVEFSVNDTGPGIAEADMPKLFQKFQQLKRTHGPGLQGTGLGLSIAKFLVELHGGRISVRSEPGKGTTFIFIIPKTKTL